MARFRTRSEKRMEEDLNENLPIDELPYSNEEHFPAEPTREQILTMKLASEKVEETRRMFGMSRRQFVRTGAAFSVCLWAANRFSDRKYGYYAMGGEINDLPPAQQPSAHACNLENQNVQLANRPGEFVFDVQSHHVMSNGKWRVLQPVHHAFICGFFGQGRSSGEVDLCTGTNRVHYFKEIFLDSATTAAVLSPIPSAPDEQQPLPFKDANETAELIENLSGGTMRVVTHGYVMPNRGWVRSQSVGCLPDPTTGFFAPEICAADTGQKLEYNQRPAFLDQELEWMEERAIKYRRYLRGWKVYSPYGDVPFASGFAHDDDVGMAMNEKILYLRDEYGIPPVLASHKGIWLPTFDNRRQACDDVPGAAMAYPDIRFVIYHSGGGGSSVYPTDLGESDAGIDKTDFNNGTNGLIKALRDAGWDALSHVPAGLEHGNTPNVAVDTGSVMPGAADQLATFFAKMIRHIGARRICYGTDAIWGGSPHRFIVKIRDLEMGSETKRIHNLPWGLDGDRFDPRVNSLTGQVGSIDPVTGDLTAEDPSEASGYTTGYVLGHPVLSDPKIGGNWPTSGNHHPERSIRNGILGRNAADLYEVDADATYGKMSCDDVQRLREDYIVNEYDSLASLERAPLRANMVYGARTKRELVKTLNEDWAKNGWHA